MDVICRLLEKEMEFLQRIEKINYVENEYGGVDGKIIGTGRSDYTRDAKSYSLNIGDREFLLIDIPGIEGDESEYEKIISSSLDKAHTIFYINGSGKKIEKESLNKIKKYMHDGTSVYAVFNVHCKAKKERIKGIDKTYTEELQVAYEKQEEIVNQTEDELKTFLGKNFKGSISVNGLLAFCAKAINKKGRTSIIIDEEKSLRTDQQKYINEYSMNIDCMIYDSRINLIQDIIEEKINNFDQYIYDENVKKLKNRLKEMITKIEKLKEGELKKIKSFENIYNEYEENCNTAKDDYIHTIKYIGNNAVEDAFVSVKEDLYNKIEKDKGKTKASEIQEYFDEKKDYIIKNIENGVNRKFKEAQDEFIESIQDAQNRLKKEFERELVHFEVCLDSDNIAIDDSFMDALKYNLETFGEDFIRVGSLALSGAAVGSIIPGIGTAIGAIVGGIVGVLSSIWNFFASEAKRINKAKEKLRREIDDQIEVISDKLSREIKKLDYEEKINDCYNQIYENAEKQKEGLQYVEKLLENVVRDLNNNYEVLR